MSQLRYPWDTRISPDGALVTYVTEIQSFDPNAKPGGDDDTSGGWKSEIQIFVASRDGREHRQLTFGKSPALAPQWSPDGRELAFLREHNGKTTIHVLPMRGGEAQALDLGGLIPQTFAYAPDGRSLAFIAAPLLSDAEKAARWQTGGAERFDEEWRSDALYLLGREPGAKPRQVSQGNAHIIKLRWSPDGKRFAVVTSQSSDPYYAWGQHTVAIIAAQTGAVERSFEPGKTTVGNIEWSPNGRYLAYEIGDNTLSLLNTLRVHDLTAQTSWNAAAKLDPTLTGFLFTPDSRAIIAHVYERTRSKLYRLSLDGRTATDLGVLDAVIDTAILHADRQGRYVAVTASSPKLAPHPAVVDLRAPALRRVVDINPHVAEWRLAQSEVVRWKNREGTQLEGILFVTPHAQAGTPPPLVVNPHGGPDGISLESFNSFAHYMAARGYSVFMPNYRGGYGYGYELYAANRGRLGEIELMDIESGVDHLIQAGKADSRRLFYGGWSWGGYITAYTITKTQRYLAAVVGAGVVDVVTQYVTSDINHGMVADWEFRGRPWQNPEQFARTNPALGLAAIKTPTLILHGRRDRRVDIINGMTLYRALKDLGTKVLFFAYPREGHGINEPAHMVHLLEAWAHWYDSHLSGADNAVSTSAGRRDTISKP